LLFSSRRQLEGFLPNSFNFPLEKQPGKEERRECGGGGGGRFLGRLYWIQVARSLAVKRNKVFGFYF
jgi:hypothetical protein